MPRPRRDDFPGAFHHVMNRGARRAPIFKLQDDCVGFLDHLADTVGRYDIEIHAYSLMPNHYHLLVRSRLGNLSDAMRHLGGRYTQWLNAVHHWDGPVFRGRFKSQLVMQEEYLRILLAYIHLNPLRANLVSRLVSEAWTSHRAYVGRETPPEWLSTDWFLDLLDGEENLHKFVLSVHRGAVEYPEDFNADTGLFKKKGLLREPPARSRHVATENAGTPHPRHRGVESVIADVCRMTGASEQQLFDRRSGPRANPERRFAVWALYRATGCKHREIAERLNVTQNQVARLLSRLRRDDVAEPLAGWMADWLAAE